MKEESTAKEKEMLKECTKLIAAKLSHDIGRQGFYEACYELHSKFPLDEREPALTRFQIENWQTIVVRGVTDKGIAYKDRIRPHNFMEAAEMYRATWLVEREPG